MKTRRLPRIAGLRRSLAAFAVASLGCLAAASSASAADVSARATYRWTENISRSSGRADFAEASEYELALSTAFHRQLSSRLYADLDLTFTGTTSPDYELLDRTEFGPRLTLRRKFGLGPNAPVLSASAALTGRYARLHEQDGVGARANLTLAKRFSPWLAASVSGEWQRHDARRSAFDVAHYGADARLILDPHPRLRFTAGLGHLDGTFTASASRNRFVNGALAGALGPAVASYFASVPTADTNNFGPAWVSYRVEGEVDSWWFDFSPALTDRTSLSLRYERNHAVNIVDVEYRQDIVSLSLNHAF